MAFSTVAARPDFAHRRFRVPVGLKTHPTIVRLCDRVLFANEGFDLRQSGISPASSAACSLAANSFVPTPVRAAWGHKCVPMIPQLTGVSYGLPSTDQISD